MNLSKWLRLIKEDLKEDLKVLLYDPGKVVKVFVEEILNPAQVKVVTTSCLKDFVDGMRQTEFQLILIVGAEKDENVLEFIKKVKEVEPISKIAVVLNYTKEEDIGNYFEEGADEVIFQPFTLNEFKARLNKLFKEYYLDRKLQKTAVEDPLTGVYNRRFFEEALQDEVYRALRQGYPLSLMMIDLDNFKWYNDNLGHQAGDRLLKHLGEVLKSNVREKVDKVCRYGGDEFVVILPYTSWKKATVVAKRICSVWKGKEVEPTSLSIGIAQLIDRGNKEKSLSDLINRADQAMYQAKNETRGQQKNSYKVDEESVKHFSNEELPDGDLPDLS